MHENIFRDKSSEFLHDELSTLICATRTECTHECNNYSNALAFRARSDGRVLILSKEKNTMAKKKKTAKKAKKAKKRA